VNTQKQNSAKHRVGLALRRYLDADRLSKEYKPFFGCEADFLRKFVGYQFTGKMSWDNFGTVWKIGHVVPVSRFDQTKRKELKVCWNWVNLRPVRDSQVRRHYSGVEAIRILEWRYQFFKDNPAIEELLLRAQAMADEEVQEMTDWTMFPVEQFGNQ